MTPVLQRQPSAASASSENVWRGDLAARHGDDRAAKIEALLELVSDLIRTKTGTEVTVEQPEAPERRLRSPAGE